jgi:hypothetical protein
MTLVTTTVSRPRPGTAEEGIYERLLPMMSRAGLPVDLAGCAELAQVIQTSGHRSAEAVELARALGLDPQYLPRRR